MLFRCPFSERAGQQQTTRSTTAPVLTVPALSFSDHQQLLLCSALATPSRGPSKSGPLCT